MKRTPNDLIALQNLFPTLSASETALKQLESMMNFSHVSALHASLWDISKGIAPSLLEPSATEALNSLNRSLGLSSALQNKLRDSDLQRLTSVSAGLNSLSTRFPAELIDRITKPAFPSSALATLESIASLTRSIRPEITSVLQTTGSNAAQAALKRLSVMDDAMRQLPAWLRPIAQTQLFQPSWELAANFGAAGLGPQGLIQDAISALHRERTQTVVFEAAVQMLEAADQDVAELGDRTLDILRTYTEAVVDLLSETKDWLARQGLIAILTLLLAAVGNYEMYVQIELARESGEPSTIQKEMAQHLETMNHAVEHIQKELTPDSDVRILIKVAPLRKDPDGKGAVLRQVYPDDRVRVIAFQGGWAKVQVFEYHSENFIEGWVNRRALRLPGTVATER